MFDKEFDTDVTRCANGKVFTTEETDAALNDIRRAVESMQKPSLLPQNTTGRYVMIDCKTEERAKEMYLILKEVLEAPHDNT